jgi:sec-independent protein translocase protein TatB
VFGISGSELVVLLAVAAVVLGPERLPQYAQQLGRLVRELRRMAQGASTQMRTEMGPEFDDIDWRKFDPRQYDPRRIVRDALSDAFDPDDPLGLNEKPVNGNGSHPMREQGAAGAAAARRRPAASEAAEPGTPPPFDLDAT